MSRISVDAVNGLPSTFPAHTPRRWPLTLIGFGFLSLAVHGLAFLLFRVVYPPAAGLVLPTPPVTVLSPGIPEHDVLLRWVAAEDPALVAASLSAPPPLQLAQEYRPSYTSLRTPPRTYSLEEENNTLLPLLNQALMTQGNTSSPAASAPRSSTHTTVTFHGPLAGRKLVSPMQWALRSAEPLQPLTLLGAVGAQGTISYTFITQSSGDEEVDRMALEVLRAAKITESFAELAWGWMTVHWGDDVYSGHASP